eukprot:TRINITY_DN3261_c0_g1_i9.p1 TRINITY_DN3261_c0_g1~~TRINITY_DN3261_c0_g1_i9.p1  ORF type:complete len:146 (+),score=20.94 TRINITY_DN3261_c0_g1_i9:58-495(+)
MFCNLLISLFCIFFFFLMIRRPPRSTQGVSSAASDVYKRQTFIYPIDIDIEERFTNDSTLSDEAIVVSDDVLDISEIVEKSIISTLPIKRVCKTDCKGLCQKCGCNLNYETCNCDKEDVDVRLQALKGFFDNKEVQLMGCPCTLR